MTYTSASSSSLHLILLLRLYGYLELQRKENEKSPQVWDLDSTLPLPSPLASYVAETFCPSFPLFSEYRRYDLILDMFNPLPFFSYRSKLFFWIEYVSYCPETFFIFFLFLFLFFRFYRIVHAPMFLRYFASDRRHMKDSDGNWSAQPPPYDPIVAEGTYDII